MKIFQAASPTWTSNLEDKTDYKGLEWFELIILFIRGERNVGLLGPIKPTS